jgi:hypothetical protein
MRGTGIAVGILFIAVAIACCIGAVTHGDDSGEVTCGDDPMARGDTCVTYTNGSSESRSYDEQSDANNSPLTPIMLGLGSVVMAFLAYGSFRVAAEADPSPQPDAGGGRGANPLD